MSKDRLVNLVCNRLLNQPMTERNTRVLDPEKHNSPFNAGDYEWQSFDRGNWESQKKFYPYFKNRGINLATQRLFADSFFLTTKQRTDGKRYTNLSFLLVLPASQTKKWDWRNEAARIKREKWCIRVWLPEAMPRKEYG